MDTFICHSFICSKCSGGGTEGLLFTPFVEPPVNLNSVRLLNLDFVKNCWQLFAIMVAPVPARLRNSSIFLFGRASIATLFLAASKPQIFTKSNSWNNNGVVLCNVRHIVVVKHVLATRYAQLFPWLCNGTEPTSKALRKTTLQMSITTPEY